MVLDMCVVKRRKGKSAKPKKVENFQLSTKKPCPKQKRGEHMHPRQKKQERKFLILTRNTLLFV